ncbi:MAG: hypothetical protein ACRDNX_08640 [Gaiellaceae bacterium]
MSELEARRSYECRLTSDRALATLDEAADWVCERGLVTGPPSGSLPSLHVACHEEPYAPDKPGFGQWPKTKFWWGGALAERPDLRWLKIHRGKSVLVSDAVAALVQPLASEELARAEGGAFGEDARRLARHLVEAGPSFVDDLKDELGLGTKSLRAARERLERVAAVVARQVVVEASTGGHRHTTELARWDQCFRDPARGPSGAGELLVAGVRAAVLVPEHEALRWFSWPVARDDVDRLVEARRLVRLDGVLHTG